MQTEYIKDCIEYTENKLSKHEHWKDQIKNSNNRIVYDLGAEYCQGFLDGMQNTVSLLSVHPLFQLLLQDKEITNYLAFKTWQFGKPLLDYKSIEEANVDFKLKITNMPGVDDK